MTEAYRKVVAEGRDVLKDKWRDSFATIDRQFGITELACSICGAQIAHLMPTGAQRVHRHGTQTIIQEFVMLGRLANYREVSMLMDDNSRHITNMCADCATKVEHDHDLQVAAYASDVAQWSKEGLKLSDRSCNRRPVSVLEVDDHIKS